LLVAAYNPFTFIPFHIFLVLCCEYNAFALLISPQS
jgi:hypothetical protein